MICDRFGTLLSVTVYQTINCRLNALENASLNMRPLRTFGSDRIKKKKTLRGKEKMLVTSIFSFSLKVFKRHFPLGGCNSGLCDKGLNSVYNRLVQKLSKFYSQNIMPFFPLHTFMGILLFRVRIHQTFLKTFFVLISRFFYIHKHLNVTQLLIG